MQLRPILEGTGLPMRPRDVLVSTPSLVLSTSASTVSPTSDSIGTSTDDGPTDTPSDVPGSPTSSTSIDSSTSTNSERQPAPDQRSNPLPPSPVTSSSVSPHSDSDTQSSSTQSSSPQSTPSFPPSSTPPANVTTVTFDGGGPNTRLSHGAGGDDNPPVPTPPTSVINDGKSSASTSASISTTTVLAPGSPLAPGVVTSSNSTTRPASPATNTPSTGGSSAPPRSSSHMDPAASVTSTMPIAISSSRPSSDPTSSAPPSASTVVFSNTPDSLSRTLWLAGSTENGIIASTGSISDPLYPAPTAVADTSTHHRPLSSKAVVAITLSVIAAIGLCVALVCLCRRRRRKLNLAATSRSNNSIYGESIIGLRVSNDGMSTSDTHRESAPSTVDIRASSGTYNFPLPPSYGYDHRHGSNMTQSANSLTVLIPSRDALRPSNRNSAVSQDSIPLPSSTYLENAVEHADWLDAWNQPRASSELMQHPDLSETTLSTHHEPSIGSAL